MPAELMTRSCVSTYSKEAMSAQRYAMEVTEEVSQPVGSTTYLAGMSELASPA